MSMHLHKSWPHAHVQNMAACTLLRECMHYQSQAKLQFHPRQHHMRVRKDDDPVDEAACCWPSDSSSRYRHVTSAWP
jgi:hypothetical protein